MLLPFIFQVNTPRIAYVTTADHGDTLGVLPRDLAARGVRLDIWSWDRVFRARKLPRATWILTDFDRLSPGQLEAAGRIYRRLGKGGLTVLNDPRRFRNRAQLLAALQAKGVNSFGCALPAAGEWPARYPAFLRTIAAHRGITGDLLKSPREAALALRAALRDGYLLSDLVFVEYCAEPVAETGRFQKHAGLVVGDRMIRANTVNDMTWKAKVGTPGLASDAQYAAERAEFHDWPHRDFVTRVFDVAGMDFGRVDFGLVGGRPQAYEVNTNPTLDMPLDHVNADRRATLALYRAAILDAFTAIATPGGGPAVSLDGAFRLAHAAVFRRPRLF